MVASTVNWINSGFEGSPAFITDFDGFLKNQADIIVGEYIYGSKLNFLCSPFSLDIKNALAIQYFEGQGQEYQPRCTLSEVTDNIDGAINDLDREWDWDVWNSITQTSTNNPFGQYIEASIAISNDITDEKDKEITKLNWGDGFLSYEKCTEEAPTINMENIDPEGESSSDVYMGPMTEEGTMSHCEIVTPGSMIMDLGAENIKLGGQELVTADEISEIVGALVSQLTQTILSSTGLIGASSSSGGQSSYTSRMVGEDTILSDDIVTRTVDTINTDIETETNYKNVKQNHLDAVNNAEERLFVLQECEASKPSFVSTVSATTTIENILNPLQDKLTLEIENSQNSIDILTPMANDISDAQTTSELNVLIEEYQIIVVSGELHTMADVIRAQNDGTIDQMTNLISSTDFQINQCQNFIVINQNENL